MYRLTYFAKRGRGEQVRLLLREADVPYQDVHVAGRSFASLQDEGASKLWFGSIPLLEDGDFRLVQGSAIMGYLGRKHGLAPTDAQGIARADAMTLGAEDLRSTYLGLWGPDGAQKQRAFVQGRWTNRWLPRLEELLHLNGDTGFFVGDNLSYADIAMWDALDAILTWVPATTLAVKTVAKGRRPLGSKEMVWVPSQRNRPGTRGSGAG